MRRRDFILLFVGVTLALPSIARAQQKTKRPLIAWLSSATQAYSASKAAVFLQAMRELGYIEGQNFNIVYRSSDGYQDRLPELAQEVVRLQPDVIFAIKNPDCLSGTRGCSPPGLNSKRGTARG